MDLNRVEFSGKELGQHGCNVYFKDFIVWHGSEKKSYRLGEFYFVRKTLNESIYVAEFQLIWKNLKTDEKHASLKLYFSPDDIPEGRLSTHGKDELLEADQHAAIECSQMFDWDCGSSGLEWRRGTQAYDDVKHFDLSSVLVGNDLCCHGNKDLLHSTKVKVLSFPAYCRYRACMKLLKAGCRLEKKLLLAKGGIELSTLNTRVMFSRCKFHHHSLEKCCPSSDVKVPVFKGRPRKRKLKSAKLTNLEEKKSSSETASSNDDEQSINITMEHDKNNDINIMMDTVNIIKQEKKDIKEILSVNHIKKELQFCMAKFKPKVKLLDMPETELEQLLSDIIGFMKNRATPILKVPKVGYTQVNLALLFTLVQVYGGYKQVTSDHRWKVVYDGLGLATTITNAATCIRRHYERLLLPYEKHLRHSNKGRLTLASISREDCNKQHTTNEDNINKILMPETKPGENIVKTLSIQPRVVNHSSQTTIVTETGTQVDIKVAKTMENNQDINHNYGNYEIASPIIVTSQSIASEFQNEENTKLKINPTLPISIPRSAFSPTQPSIMRKLSDSGNSSIPFIPIKSPIKATCSIDKNFIITSVKSLKTPTFIIGPGFSQASSLAPRPPPLVPIINQEPLPPSPKRSRHESIPRPLPTKVSVLATCYPDEEQDYKKISISSILPDMKIKDVNNVIMPFAKEMHGTLEDLRRVVSRSTGLPIPPQIVNTSSMPSRYSIGHHHHSNEYEMHRRSPSYIDTYHQQHINNNQRTIEQHRHNQPIYIMSHNGQQPDINQNGQSTINRIRNSSSYERDLVCTPHPNQARLPDELVLNSKNNHISSHQCHNSQQMTRYPQGFYDWQQNREHNNTKSHQGYNVPCHWPKDNHDNRTHTHQTSSYISKTY